MSPEPVGPYMTGVTGANRGLRGPAQRLERAFRDLMAEVEMAVLLEAAAGASETTSLNVASRVAVVSSALAELDAECASWARAATPRERQAFEDAADWFASWARAATPRERQAFEDALHRAVVAVVPSGLNVQSMELAVNDRRHLWRVAYTDERGRLCSLEVPIPPVWPYSADALLRVAEQLVTDSRSRLSNGERHTLRQAVASAASRHGLVGWALEQAGGAR